MYVCMYVYVYMRQGRQARPPQGLEPPPPPLWWVGCGLENHWFSIRNSILSSISTYKLGLQPSRIVDFPMEFE